jgi:MSHA biogenesis protein MshP
VYQVQATAAYNFSYGTPVVAVGSANPNNRACPASPTSFVPTATTLAGFTVTVTCAATAAGSGGPTVYELTSTACNQPNGGACPNTTAPGNFYIERRLTVTF